MIALGENVSTTDDEFPALLSTDDDMSKQEEWATRKARTSLMLSVPCACLNVYPCRIVKVARRM